MRRSGFNARETVKIIFTCLGKSRPQREIPRKPEISRRDRNFVLDQLTSCVNRTEMNQQDAEALTVRAAYRLAIWYLVDDDDANEENIAGG